MSSVPPARSARHGAVVTISSLFRGDRRFRTGFHRATCPPQVGQFDGTAIVARRNKLGERRSKQRGVFGGSPRIYAGEERFSAPEKVGPCYAL